MHWDRRNGEISIMPTALTAWWPKPNPIDSCASVPFPLLNRTLTNVPAFRTKQLCCCVLTNLQDWLSLEAINSLRNLLLFPKTNDNTALRAADRAHILLSYLVESRTSNRRSRSAFDPGFADRTYRLINTAVEYKPSNAFFPYVTTSPSCRRQNIL